MTNRRSFVAIAATAGAALAAVTQQPSMAARATASRKVSGSIKTKSGVELFVKDWGAGRPIVLTHAWPLSSECWEEQAIAMADAGYRVISYDRRGFGRSSQPADGYDYNTYADDLAEVIRATGAKDVTLAGFSMGGGEVVRYLSRHGSKNVVGVALVASVAPGLAKGKNNPNGVGPEFFNSLIEDLRKDRTALFSGLLRNVFYDVDTSAKSTHPVTQAVLDWSMQMAAQASLPALIGSVTAFGNEDFVPDLQAVTMPTLILHGNADKPVPFELTARRAAAGIKQSTLIEYDGTTHGILVTERDRVTRDLLAFMAA
jgi:non-heme chloroperoxidase